MIYSIFEQLLVVFPLLCGAYITLSLLKLPDFALESAYLCGAVAAYLGSDFSLPLILFLSVFGGTIVGALVTFLNQFLRIPFLLSAIVTNGFVHGATLLLLKGTVNAFKLSINLTELQLLFIVSGGCLLLIFFIMRSQMGYAFAIFGNNPRFLGSHRIKESYVVFIGIALAHSLAGMSGFLFSLTSGVVDVTMNFGVIMMCLTALMIGKFLKKGDQPTVLVPIVGVIGYFLMQQMLLKLGFNLKYFNAVQALFVLLFICTQKRSRNFTLDHLGV